MECPVFFKITYWVYLLIIEPPQKHELRTKKGTLWIYGDSVNIFFAQSLMQRKLCRDIFKRCNFSYNWIYPVTNVTAAKKENDDRDYDNERVLQSLRHVLHDPQMDENSAIIMNFGLHFVESTNFTNYKKLIDGLVKVLTDEQKVSTLNVTSPKFRGTVIWKTTTAINKEKASNIHLGHKRFLTQQVKYHLPSPKYHLPREDEGWEIRIPCRPYSQFLLKLFLDHSRFRKPCTERSKHSQFCGTEFAHVNSSSCFTFILILSCHQRNASNNIFARAAYHI